MFIDLEVKLHEICALLNLVIIRNSYLLSNF